jgi:hypothetical protein
MSTAKKFFTLAMLLMSLLMGCAAVPAAYGAEPAEIEAHGQYTHEPSGMVFPEAVLNFKRVEIFRYDEEGRDVSAGYNLERKDSTIIATVYVYPIPQSGDPSADVVGTHFEGVKQAITSAHTDAKLLQDDEVRVTQGKVSKCGLHVLFRFEQPTPAGPQMCSSEAFLFTHGKWFIKYRLTYPEAKAEPCVKEIKAFMETLKWPEGS